MSARRPGALAAAGALLLAATPGQPHPRPGILPGTFRLLVVEPRASAMTMSGGKARP